MERWRPFHLGAREVLVVPGSALLPSDPASVVCFIEDALAHPEGRAAFAEWLGVSDAQLEEPETRARAKEILTRRSWRAVEVGRVAEARSPPRPTDPIRPTDPTGPVRPRPARPTFLAITVVDEDGLGFVGTSWTVTTADGDDRRALLDERSSWRADDIRESGTCIVRVGASLPEPTGALPGFAGIPADARSLGAEARAQVAVRTGAEHTIVVVRGRTEIEVLDDAGRPAADELCEVKFGGEQSRLRTNAQGVAVLWHPRTVESVELSFVSIQAGAVKLERSVALGTESGGK